MKNLRVLIPSYNESKTIGAIVKRLKSRGFTVYVVDDGSTDDTASVSDREGAIVIKNKANLGKGASLRRGFERILRDGCDAVLIMDGDDQHDIADITHLLKKMHEGRGADIVVGNRMFDTIGMPRTRIVVNWLLSGLISGITGQYVPDTQCGFRLIKREVLEKVKLESSNFEIESEMIIKGAKAGFRIDSAPVKTVYRNEKSRINPIIDTIRFIALMIKLSFKK
ncbi:MAG: glycosyltransferase family 2 protein [Candidatus Omnitrophota bacterium]|nr:glycosyltransferase family 2 protein [Candidatus Omnitrophota bacterium]